MSSVTFMSPISNEALDVLTEVVGHSQAEDGKTFLFNGQKSIDARQMKRIANAANQPVEVGLHSEGDEVTLSGDRKYRVTDRGWVRI